MKKSFFAVVAAGVCATALLVGCGDSSSSPSKSRVQKCANGLSDECLIGTWNLNGLANLATPTRDIRTPDFDYQANPGKLVFKADGTLEFTFPANAPADLILTDAMKLPESEKQVTDIIKGDQKSISIAAASILASQCILQALSRSCLKSAPKVPS